MIAAKEYLPALRVSAGKELVCFLRKVMAIF